MSAPHVIECPVCFATLKLKVAPKRGARLKCPKCAGVFSPDASEPAPVVEEDDPAEDDVPVSRPKSRGKAAGKKKKKKPVNLAVPIALAIVALLLVGGGVGLYLAKDKLFGGQPTVDLAYCQVPNRSMSLEFRVQEFLQSSSVSEAIRNGPQFGGSSPAMKELIGAEIGDVEVMQAQISAGLGGMNPMMGAMAPNDALAVLKCKKTLTPPATGSFDHQGVKCYRVNESGSGGMGLKSDTMFFPNPTTVVIGKEATVRQILDNWKAGAAKPAAPVANSGATMFFAAEQTLVSSMLTQLTSGNPMMAMGPMAGLSEDLKSAGLVLSQHATAFSVSAQLGGGQVAWSAAVHGRDASGAQQIQVALDGLRTKLLGLISSLTQMGLPIPESNKKNLELAQQALGTPFQATGDRVTIAVPIPPDQQANSIAMLAMLMPPMSSLKLGSGTTPAGTATTPTMPTGAPMMPHGAPGIPTTPSTP